MTISDLPWDLVEDILYRVPAASLKQLGYTCKRWNRLLKGSRFTRKHLEKAAKQSVLLMLKNDRVCSMSVNPLSNEPWDSLEKRFSLTNGVHVDQLEICQGFHCDGLLLCTNKHENKIVVWNPCTGQTRWIQPSNGYKTSEYYALGSYQDKKSGHNSYKVLSYDDDQISHDQIFHIYDINSDSWRTLDVTPDCELLDFDCTASLKGNTYWVGYGEKEKQLGMPLVCFDYTTENFELCQCPIGNYRSDVALSVVREEKLSLLLHNEDTWRTEIWVTNKIGESKAKVVRWNHVFTVELKHIIYGLGFVSYLVDEEKKILVCCCKLFGGKSIVYTVGEDNRVKEIDFGLGSGSFFLFNYVPSLTQIKQGLGGKRKREE